MTVKRKNMNGAVGKEKLYISVAHDASPTDGFENESILRYVDGRH